MIRAATFAIWILSLATLLSGGVLATVFVFMATSMDPTDLATEGLQPWGDALEAVAAFVGLVVVTLLALRLWHSLRFKVLGALLTIADAGLVGWACARVYADYF